MTIEKTKPARKPATAASAKTDKAPKPAKDPRRSADSSEKAYAIIRKQLVEFQLKPDERINEVQLARSLGLSRTPIREALNRLASEGFVALTPNRGFFFRALDIDDLLDLYELRSIIECAAFTLMCERGTDADLDRLNTYWQAASIRYRERDPDEILQLDEGFHLLIAELSGNPEIRNQLATINARIRFIRRIQIQHVSHDQDQVTAHSRIVDAALARDAGKGVELLKSHIVMTVSATKRALKDALLKVYVGDAEGRRRGREAGES
ncbi:GntR family transcriptional regulator [Ensifer soli]|uniref:GntR family transcriptional regulator n=1 Tax=Ciceribacter sp. sgz301302 TaxID=3342379 RepID=UPI0035B6DD0B